MVLHMELCSASKSLKKISEHISQWISSIEWIAKFNTRENNYTEVNVRLVFVNVQQYINCQGHLRTFHVKEVVLATIPHGIQTRDAEVEGVW